MASSEVGPVRYWGTAAQRLLAQQPEQHGQKQTTRCQTEKRNEGRRDIKGVNGSETRKGRDKGRGMGKGTKEIRGQEDVGGKEHKKMRRKISQITA